MLRWLSLRFLISLIALPFITAIIIAIMHLLVLPGIYFQDAPIIFMLWLSLFVGAHYVLSNVGQRRFDLLIEEGWQALKSNQIRWLNEVFLQIDQVLSGGLLSGRKTSALQQQLMRRYFDYYRENVKNQAFRKGLIACLKHNIRAEDAFRTLKAYLMQQNQLTISLVDLAEILLEHNPNDENIADFMVEKYITDKQRHFRAEYFYIQELEKNGPLTEKIINLCLPALNHSSRLDDFSCWIYLRVIGRDPHALDHFALRLYRVNKINKTACREDRLAKEISSIIVTIPPEKIAQFERDEANTTRKKLGTHLERFTFLVQQKAIWLWGEILRHRQVLVISLASLAVILVLLLVIPFESIFQEKPATLEEEIAQMPIQNPRFSVQVSAIKSRSNARKELNRLKSNGVDAFMVEPERQGGWYKIYAGRLATQQEAKQYGDSLRSRKVIRDFFVVNYKGTEKK